MQAFLFKRYQGSEYFKGVDARVEAGVTVRHNGKTTIFNIWEDGQVVRQEGPVSQEALALAVKTGREHGYKTWSH